jgi:type II secretory pathway component GspD/PulD (secretin)
MFGIGMVDASVIARMSRSDSKTLLRTEVRSLDGLPATVHVGDKFPVMTAGYFGPSSFGGGTAGAFTPPPSFTFEDLGVTMKITPHIHGMDEVTLDFEAEFKVLSGQSLNGIPVISNRKMTSTVRLGVGDWGVVAGLMSSSEARSIHGIAGLAEIPGLGQLFRVNNKDETTSDVILLIKPTLLNLPPDQFASPAMWVGPDARPLTPL